MSLYYKRDKIVKMNLEVRGQIAALSDRLRLPEKAGCQRYKSDF